MAQMVPGPQQMHRGLQSQTYSQSLLVRPKGVRRGGEKVRSWWDHRPTSQNSVPQSSIVLPNLLELLWDQAVLHQYKLVPSRESGLCCSESPVAALCTWREAWMYNRHVSSDRSRWCVPPCFLYHDTGLLTTCPHLSRNPVSSFRCAVSSVRKKTVGMAMSLCYTTLGVWGS